MNDKISEKVLQIVREREAPPYGRPPVSALAVYEELIALMRRDGQARDDLDFATVLRELVKREELRVVRGTLENATLLHAVWVVSSLCQELPQHGRFQQ